MHYSVLLLIHQLTDRPPCLGEHEGKEEGGGWKSDAALCYCLALLATTTEEKVQKEP